MDTQDTYLPLNAGLREIRLLELIVTATPEKAEFKARCFALDETPPFIALSYVWGSTQRASQIRLVGFGKAAVTENLLDAIGVIHRIFRMRVEEAASLVCDTAVPPPRYLWADAICINQEDEIEKGQQVGMMRDIYRRAVAVWAWFGPVGDGDEGSHAMRTLATIGALPWPSRTMEDILNDPGREGISQSFSWMQHSRQETLKSHKKQARGTTTTSSATGVTEAPMITPEELVANMTQQMNPEQLSSAMQQNLSVMTSILPVIFKDVILCSPQDFDSDDMFAFHPRILRFLAHPFWSRVWILQEIFLARELIFFCGHETTVSGIAVCAGVRLLGDYYRINKIIARSVALEGPAIQRTRGPPFALAAYLQDRMKAGGLELGQLLDMVVRTGIKATDPRDIVYGLLGMVEVGAGIPVDYTATTSEVFIRVTTLVIQQTRDLRLVILACHCREEARARHQQDLPWLPSWVPDLSLTSNSLPDPIHRRFFEPSARVIEGGDEAATLVLKGNTQGLVVERAEVLHSPHESGGERHTLARMLNMTKVLLATIQNFQGVVPTSVSLATIQDNFMRHLLMAQPALASSELQDAQYEEDRQTRFSELFTQFTTLVQSSLTYKEIAANFAEIIRSLLTLPFTSSRLFKGLLNRNDGDISTSETNNGVRRIAWSILSFVVEEVFQIMNQVPGFQEVLDDSPWNDDSADDHIGERAHTVKHMEKLYEGMSDTLPTMFIMNNGRIGSGVRDVKPGDLVVSVCDGSINLIFRLLSSLESAVEVERFLSSSLSDNAVKVTFIGVVDISGESHNETVHSTQLFSVC